MPDKDLEELQSKIEPIVTNCGLELVELKVSKYGNKCTICCLVDYAGGGVTVKECAALNKKIFSFLDESKLFGDDFILEVNSPGIERPLKTYKDFLRSIGRVVCLWLNESIGGKSYVEGELCSVSHEQLTLRNKEDFYRIDINIIKIGKERVDL